MICDEVIEAYLGKLRGEFACAQRGERLCVTTPYLYPDHDNIEVFVRDREHYVTVSDLGETLRRLDMLGIDVAPSKRFHTTASRIAKNLSAAIDRGVICSSGSPRQVGGLVYSVASACRSVADLMYGFRGQDKVSASFKNECEVREVATPPPLTRERVGKAVEGLFAGGEGDFLRITSSEDVQRNYGGWDRAAVVNHLCRELGVGEG